MKKVNPFLPADDAAKLVAAIAAGEAAVRKYLQPLTPKQRRSLLKMKTGGEKAIAQLVTIIANHGVQVPGASVDDMQAAAAAAASLHDAVASLSGLSQGVADLVVTLQSTAWTNATTFYSVLKRAAKTNPSLLASLQSINDLFSRRSQAAQDKLALKRANAEQAKATKALAKKNAKAAATQARVQEKLADAGIVPAPAAPAPEPTAIPTPKAGS